MSEWYTIKIKPVSANRMHCGRKKVDSLEYREYKNQFKTHALKKPIDIPENCQLHFKMIVYLSSKLADLDNTIKPCLDAIQCCNPSFNDRTVYNISAKKVIVGKGDEKIKFKFTRINNSESN